MELNGVELDPILASRIERWIGEIGEIRAMYDAIDEGNTDIGSYAQAWADADERASFADEDAREILEWLLAEIGLWPEQQGAPG